MNGTGLRAVLFCLACLLAGMVNAQVSEAERQALIDLYHATGGDDWHVNDGWLGEAGSECNWHGVQCNLFDGDYSVQHLLLEDNGLAGSLPDALTHLSRLQSLQLGRNHLTGDNLAPAFLLPELWTLKLDHNPLGSLPATLPDTPATIGRLHLSVTGLEGDPPVWFEDLAVRDLNLAGNRLGSDIEPWLAALADERIRLDLSRNRFEGPLPASLLEIDFERNTSGMARGLNLCWNQFDEPADTELEDFLAEVHVGDTLTDCNHRDLTAIDPAVSGSWFNPERSGKGYSLMLLESGQMLYYWFGYPYAGDYSPQMWTFQIGEPEEQAVRLPYALVPHGGEFGQGLGEEGFVSEFGRRIVDIVRLGPDQLSVSTHSQPEIRSSIIIGPPPPAVQDRFVHQRLTRLAGTTCDNQSDFQQYSGAWYNPEQDGEGFIIEVLPDDRVVIYWFTYAADGSGDQAWMIADAIITSSGVTLPGIPDPPAGDGIVEAQVYRHVGGELIPELDPESIETIDWGTLSISFDDADHGHVWFDSHDPDFGSGDYPIERLARPMLAECEGDD